MSLYAKEVDSELYSCPPNMTTFALLNLAKALLSPNLVRGSKLGGFVISMLYARFLTAGFGIAEDALDANAIDGEVEVEVAIIVAADVICKMDRINENLSLISESFVLLGLTLLFSWLSV